MVTKSGAFTAYFLCGSFLGDSIREKEKTISLVSSECPRVISNSTSYGSKSSIKKGRRQAKPTSEVDTTILSGGGGGDGGICELDWIGYEMRAYEEKLATFHCEKNCTFSFFRRGEIAVKNHRSTEKTRKMFIIFSF